MRKATALPRLLLLLCMALLVAPATAQVMQEERPLAEQAQEQRARALFRELRCEVCEGQTIADSNAPLAQDMRILVREKIGAGESDDDILGFFSVRYGDSILMRPPLDNRTVPLWFAPVFILVLGAWFLMRYFTRKRNARF